MTSDLQNLSTHSEYGGNEDIMVGNGKKIPITHVGTTMLISPNTTFQLNDVLCAPNIKQNLLSVSQFCSHNNTSIEFFPNFFLVKDLSTGASLVRGRSRGNVYEWPTALSSPSASLSITSSSVTASAHPDSWHC